MTNQKCQTFLPGDWIELLRCLCASDIFFGGNLFELNPLLGPGRGFKYCSFLPLPGDMIHFDQYFSKRLIEATNQN